MDEKVGRLMENKAAMDNIANDDEAFESLKKYLRTLYGKSRTTVFAAQSQFVNRNQREGENVRLFLAELMQLATLAYPQVSDAAVRKFVFERFVGGLTSTHARIRINTETDASKANCLERAINLAEIYHQAESANTVKTGEALALSRGLDEHYINQVAITTDQHFNNNNNSGFSQGYNNRSYGQDNYSKPYYNQNHDYQQRNGDLRNRSPSRTQQRVRHDKYNDYRPENYNKNYNKYYSPANNVQQNRHSASRGDFDQNIPCARCDQVGHRQEQCNHPIPLNRMLADHNAATHETSSNSRAISASANSDRPDGHENDQVNISSCTTSRESERIFLRCQLEGITTKCLVDTGADTSIISEAAARRLGTTNWTTTTTNAKLANGTYANVVGNIIINFIYGNFMTPIRMIIINNLTQDCLLGLDILKLIPATAALLNSLNNLDLAISGPRSIGKTDKNNTNISIVSTTEELISVPATDQLLAAGYGKTHNIKNLEAIASDPTDSIIKRLRAKLLVFVMSMAASGLSDIIQTPYAQHVIKVTCDKPIKQKMRPIPHAKRVEFKKIIDEQLAAGIIERSNSSWASPVNLVKKEDGSIRITIDYRRLNQVTVKDSYPLPIISEILSTLSKAKYFSKFDLSNGYYQIMIEPHSRHYTAFVCQEGLFQYIGMGMGLTGATGTFQRFMNNILGDYIGSICYVYLDDVIVFSRSLQDHEQHVFLILERLKLAGLQLKPAKCELVVTETLFLGHIVSEGCIKPNPKKIKALADFERPSSIKTIQAFVGLGSYYRRFIKNFAAIAKPLFEVTANNNKKFFWNERCEDAFQKIRSALTNETVMSQPDFAKPFIVECDASQYGIGAVLSQNKSEQNQLDRPIAYFSASLNKSQQKWSVSERELFAIVRSVEFWNEFLYGTTFKIFSDHRPLRYILTSQKPCSRLCRWLIRLQNYTFTIEYKRGINNNNADALSRLPEEEQAEAAEIITTSEDLVIINLISDEFSICFISLDMPTTTNEQERDPDLVWLKERLEKGNITESQAPVTGERLALDKQIKALKVANNTIWRIYTDKLGNVLDQYVVPKHQRAAVISALHDSAWDGHLGASRTIVKCSNRFYWPSMRTDVIVYCRSCLSCQKVKPPKQYNVAPLVPIKAEFPMDIVAFDLVGPLKETPRGNKYVLIQTCMFSKWVHLSSLSIIKTIRVAPALLEFFLVFGLPRRILSDCGTNFQSKLMNELWDLLDIHKLRTSSYHPSST